MIVSDLLISTCWANWPTKENKTLDILAYIESNRLNMILKKTSFQKDIYSLPSGAVLETSVINLGTEYIFKLDNLYYDIK